MFTYLQKSAELDRLIDKLNNLESLNTSVKVELANLRHVDGRVVYVTEDETVTDAVERLDDRDSDLQRQISDFKSVTYTYPEVTMQPNASAPVVPTATNIPEGYTPLALRFYSTESSYIFSRSVSAVSGTMNLVNTSSTARTVTPRMIVICVRSEVVS